MFYKGWPQVPNNRRTPYEGQLAWLASLHLMDPFPQINLLRNRRQECGLQNKLLLPLSWAGTLQHYRKFKLIHTLTPGCLNTEVKMELMQICNVARGSTRTPSKPGPTQDRTAVHSLLIREGGGSAARGTFTAKYKCKWQHLRSQVITSYTGHARLLFKKNTLQAFFSKWGGGKQRSVQMSDGPGAP